MRSARTSSRRKPAAALAAALVPLFALGILAETPQAPAGQATRAAQVDMAAKRAADRMRALQQEAETLATREQTILGELRKLEVERDLRTEELAELRRTLAALAREQEQTTARLAALEGQVKTARPGLAARLVEISKLGHGGYVRLLFGVEGVRAAGRAYRTVAVLAHQDRVRASTYRASVTELRITQKQLAERRVRTEALEVEAARASAAAGQAVAARTALVDQIDARRDLNAQLVGELEAARQKLRTLPLPSSAAQPGGAEPALLPLRPFRGDLDWPVTGRVVSRFGRQTNPRFGTSTYQAGMAVAATRDTPVHAIHEGVVAFAEPFVGFGNLVIVDHGNQAFSLYGHLSTVLVQRGTRVARGLTLGTVGTSPAGSAELYFELRIDGKPVDPVQWLRTR